MIRQERVHGGRSGLLLGTVLQLSAVSANSKLTKLTGMATPYNMWTPRSWYQLSVARGSLDKSISEAGGRLPLLLKHDWEAHPIGHSVDWDSRRNGLFGEWDLADSQAAQETARLARDGHMTGLSISFSPVISDWEFSEDLEYPVVDIRDLDKMTLVEGRLLETSVLPVPAYATAQVATVLAPPRHASSTPRLDSWKAWRDTLGDKAPTT